MLFVGNYKFILVGPYRSPSSDVNVSLDRLSWLIDNLNKKSENVILLGDFNIDIIKNSTQYENLKNLKSFNLMYTVNFPTVFQGSMLAIDNFLTNHNIDDVLVTGVITLLSDHDGQVFEILNVNKHKDRNSYLVQTKEIYQREIYKRCIYFCYVATHGS